MTRTIPSSIWQRLSVFSALRLALIVALLLGATNCYKQRLPPNSVPNTKAPVVAPISQSKGPTVSTESVAEESAVHATVQPAVATVPLDYFGLHIHRADNGTAWPVATFGSWRLWDAYAQWMHTQPARNSWDFARLDRYVALAQANKVSLLLPLGLSPKWASARPNEPSAYGLGYAAEPTLIEDWRVYVRTVGQRYKGKINAFEIWNEPNDKTFFSGTTAKLVELTCEAFKTLKAIDPSIIVVSPAYTGEQNISMLEDFLAQGGSQCIDVVAYHLYVPLNPPEVIPPLVEKIKLALARQNLGHLPLWNTESGWIINNTDGTPEDKVPVDWLRVGSELSAGYVARAYLLASASGIGRYYWYAWDGGSLGLLEPTTRKPKPGGIALSTVAKWMTDSPIPVCSEASRIWQCVLEDYANARRVVVWSVGGAAKFAAPAGWIIQLSERVDGRTESLILPGASIGTDEIPRLLHMTPDPSLNP